MVQWLTRKNVGVALGFVFSMHVCWALEFVGFVQEIPLEIQQFMIGRSWKPECPVPLEDLRYLEVAHWGFDEEVHTGHIIVHEKIAQEILEIFNELFDAHFLIERLEIIDFYDADDDRSMTANNSSAFCFRENTTLPGVYSHHSYGIAIDINPQINPYLRNSLVLPENGRPYLDRSLAHPGIIIKSLNNPCYKAFISRGYEWGGDFVERTDYQHFSKQLNVIL